MVGDVYTIVDMDVWGWARLAPSCSARAPGRNFLTSSACTTRSARVPRRRDVALKEKFAFKAEWDDEARGNMHRHLAIKVA